MKEAWGVGIQNGKTKKEEKSLFWKENDEKDLKGAVLKFKGVSEGKPVSGTTTI